LALRATLKKGAALEQHGVDVGATSCVHLDTIARSWLRKEIRVALCVVPGVRGALPGARIEGSRASGNGNILAVRLACSL